MADAQVGLPDPPRPRGRYAAAVAHRGTIVTAGMTPRRDGDLVARGLVGAEVDERTATDAAGLAARNALAAAAHAAGGLDHVTQLVSMTVYVACVESFTRVSAVADGASDALAALLGGDERSAMARVAVGVRVLPDGAPVEVQLTVGCEPVRGRAARGPGAEGSGEGEGP